MSSLAADMGPKGAPSVIQILPQSSVSGGSCAQLPCSLMTMHGECRNHTERDVRYQVLQHLGQQHHLVKMETLFQNTMEDLAKKLADGKKILAVSDHLSDLSLIQEKANKNSVTLVNSADLLTRAERKAPSYQARMQALSLYKERFQSAVGAARATLTILKDFNLMNKEDCEKNSAVDTATEYVRSVWESKIKLQREIAALNELLRAHISGIGAKIKSQSDSLASDNMLGNLALWKAEMKANKMMTVAVKELTTYYQVFESCLAGILYPGA